MTSRLAFKCLQLSVAQQDLKKAEEKVKKLQREIDDMKNQLRNAIWHRIKKKTRPFGTATLGKSLIRASIRRNIIRLYDELDQAKRETDLAQFMFNMYEEQIMHDNSSGLAESITL